MKEDFDHISDEMLVKYLAKEASRAEVAAVEEWLSMNMENQKYFDGFELVWKESKNLAPATNVDVNEAWKRFQKRIQPERIQKAHVKSITLNRFLRIAAMVILMAGAGLFAYIIFGTNKNKSVAIESKSNVIVDTLPDRSVITLNKNSTLTYPEKFNEDTRTVALEGEAFFNVSPDKSKPFIIHVNDITVKVVGTSFNIKSENGTTEVIVETGIVEVIKNDKEIRLTPGEKVVANKEDTVLVKENEKGTLYNYYRTREFECDNTPLWKLVEVLNEAYEVNIVIENKELRNLPLTTTFNNESLDTILQIIRETFNVDISKAGNKIVIK